MKKVDRRQLPSLYLKLARTFIKIGDLDLAKLTCERGVEQFPNDSILLTMQGNVLINLYNKNKNQQDAVGALKSFEKSLSLNPDNYLAALLSAKIYLKGKVYSKAKEKLLMILEHSPGDTKASDLLKLVERIEKNKKDDQPKGNQPDELEEVEEQDISDNYDILSSNLNQFSRLGGVQSCLLVDRFGMVIKSQKSSKIDEGKYGMIIANVLRSSQGVMEKNGLGVFRQGTLITPSYYLYIVAIKGALLILIVDFESDHGAIEKKITRYIQEISLQWASQKS